jgi:hypothetical protein
MMTALYIAGPRNGWSLIHFFLLLYDFLRGSSFCFSIFGLRCNFKSLLSQCLAAVSFLEGFFEVCCGDVLPFRGAALGFVTRFLLP